MSAKKTYLVVYAVMRPLSYPNPNPIPMPWTSDHDNVVA